MTLQTQECAEMGHSQVVDIKQIDGTNTEKAASQDSLGLQQDDV